MWTPISSFIIKNRLILLIVLASATLFMAYQATRVEMTYDFVKVVPKNDPDLEYYEKFRSQYGEDGNMLVLGMKDEKLYRLENFQKFYMLCDQLNKVEGIKDVISIPTLRTIHKNNEISRFELASVFNRLPETQAELDSLLKLASEVKIFENQIMNPETGATLVAIAIDKDVLNSARRAAVVDDVLALADAFGAETSISMHYAGLPYVRAIMVKEVQGEFKLFLILAAIVTSAVLFSFFRSWHTVLLTFLIIITTVVWTLGILVLLGFKITLLTGILPALIIVIGIPNCVYMFNKFHQEFRKHGNKVKAVSRCIQKIGALTLMTNFTTALGFFVLYFTDISIIKEFGLTAGVVSMSTFMISNMIIPSLLIYLPAPDSKQLKHLDLSALKKILHILETGALRRRRLVYSVMIVVICVGVYGAFQVKSISYMVDDLPSKSDVKADLAFLEDNFGGVMPLEVVVDLKKPKSVMKLENLEKLEEFETYLKSLDHVSAPLSILNVVKGATQAFYNGNPAQYRLPSSREQLFIVRYLGKSDDSKGIMNSLVDSLGSQARFSAKVADRGSDFMDALIKKEIMPKAKEIFAGTDFEVRITGTTLLFLKGNQFLIDGLRESLFFAILSISTVMALLFKNLKMVLISLIPNVIPLILTTGIMGLFSIPLKPSTALIFSVAFGIAVDDSIHFLSKYRQEMKLCDGNVLLSVTKALKETGVSMIYTSIVLFFGFVIFAFSSFGGTVALGILTSITLFFAMFTNLTLLPSMLITANKGYRNNLFTLIPDQRRFYTEDEDEEIDISKLQLETKSELQTNTRLQGEEVQRV